MRIISQIGIIFAVCWLGEIISAALPFTFPSSIIAMILLFLFLLFRIVKVDHIKEKSNFLLSNMSFFFIPISVSIIEDYQMIKESLLPFLVICIVGTIITFTTTVFTIRIVTKILSGRKRGKKNDE